MLRKKDNQYNPNLGAEKTMGYKIRTLVQSEVIPLCNRLQFLGIPPSLVDGSFRSRTDD